MSGVNASGPLISLVTLTSSITGTRRFEFSVISSKRSQSSSSRRPLKSGGIALEAAGPVGQERRLGLALVAAHHQAAAVLAVVDEQVGIAQGRQPVIRGVLAKRLRHQVLVRHRDHRHPDARHPPDLRGEHAAGVDDDLGVDAAHAR